MNALEDVGSDRKIASFLREEIAGANRVKKKDKPLMIVIGNPPYSVKSQNKDMPFIENLLNDYKKEPGTRSRLKEKTPKSLNDDYVKFIRLGEHYITKSETGGILTFFITPHGFLDNLIFSGMRYRLLQTFRFIP